MAGVDGLAIGRVAGGIKASAATDSATERGDSAMTVGNQNRKADDRQVGGSHYKDAAVQPWEAMQAWMTPEQFKGFLRGNAIKYLARCDWKGGVEDLEKARHYLDKLIEELAEST